MTTLFTLLRDVHIPILILVQIFQFSTEDIIANSQYLLLSSSVPLIALIMFTVSKLVYAKSLIIKTDSASLTLPRFVTLSFFSIFVIGFSTELFQILTLPQLLFVFYALATTTFLLNKAMRVTKTEPLKPEIRYGFFSKRELTSKLRKEITIHYSKPASLLAYQIGHLLFIFPAIITAFDAISHPEAILVPLVFIMIWINGAAIYYRLGLYLLERGWFKNQRRFTLITTYIPYFLGLFISIALT